MFNYNNTHDHTAVKRALELNLLGCPCCGKELDNFKLLKNGVYQVTDEEEQAYKGHGIPIRSTIKLICLKCGYISEFESYTLMRKYEEEVKEFSQYYPSGRTDVPLDERQKNFVEEFLKCEDKNEAAQKSGYAYPDAPLRVKRIVNAIKAGRQAKLEEEKRKKFHKEAY